jgi:ABC-type multidrug transport system fused ATPase/permease subunit
MTSARILARLCRQASIADNLRIGDPDATQEEVEAIIALDNATEARIQRALNALTRIAPRS